MADVDRRAALVALAAAAATLTWRPAARADELAPHAPRVRAGGRVTLSCPGATAFRLSLGAEGARGIAVVAAQGGAATFRVPVLDDDEVTDDWTPLVCTPLRDGQVTGAQRRVDVLTAPVSFGT